MELSELLKQGTNFTEYFQKEWENSFQKKTYAKGDHLFSQGDICQHLYYIEKGFIRVYYYSFGGKEITAWFSAENTLVTAIDSFYNHQPTRDNCEALEDTIVYTIKYSELEAILHDEKGAQMVFYILYEVARKMTAFIFSIKFQSAEERYKSLIETYPSILQRASLGQIASFLGITQETLSRIRANK